MSPSVDRRVRRTRRALKEALLSLLQERAYARITVQDILDRADVGRSTFYAHFSSKEDLLFDGFGEGLAHLDAWGDAPRPLAFVRPMLVHVRTQKRFFLATFFGATDPRIRDRVRALMTRHIRAALERDSHASAHSIPDRTLDARAHALAAAFIGLTHWWLTEGDEVEPEAVERIFLELAGVSV